MFGKAAPKKCLPRTTKRYQKITRTYRKSGASGLVATFCLVTFGKSPRYLLQCRDTKCDPRCWKKIICKGIENNDETVIDVGCPSHQKSCLRLEMQ